MNARIRIFTCALGLFCAAVLSLGEALGILPPCGTDGCARVAASALARPAGVPLAYLGLLFWGTVTTVEARALASRRPAGRPAALLATIGCLASVFLVGYATLVLRASCIWCLGSATAAIAYAVLHLLAGDLRPEPLAPWRSTSLVLLSLAGAAYVVVVRPLPVHDADALRRTSWTDLAPAGRGRVAFLDPRCPACRAWVRRDGGRSARRWWSSHPGSEGARACALAYAAERAGAVPGLLDRLSGGSGPAEVAREFGFAPMEKDFRAVRETDRLARRLGLRQTPVVLIRRGGGAIVEP